jgi:SynChlorMet cassette protein ScmC
MLANPRFLPLASTPPRSADSTFLLHAWRLSTEVADGVGGILMHGGLVVSGGRGVLLAGPSGVGKTTACGRLERPWQSLSDDATLLVHGRKGVCWAHPWPTWSRFVDGGSGGAWDVQRRVQLKAIFVLRRGKLNRARLLGPGHSLAALVPVGEQIASYVERNLPEAQIRRARLRRFSFLCGLVKTVPCYTLHLTRHGHFWKEMERVLGLGH